MAGTSNSACGSGGSACGVCGGNQLCLFNQCLDVTAGCGPQSCNGCCSQGVCLAGTDNSACGSGGSACQGCLFLCFGGQCLGGFGGSSGDAGPGDPCSFDNDCMASSSFLNIGSCIMDTETDGGPSGWPGGYCAPNCQVGSCPGNGVCMPYNQYCYEPCPAPGTGRSTCRQGYVCDYQTGEDGGMLSGQSGICWANCHNAGRTCTNGTHCSTLGYCQ
jgi:hypothetical protein